eukprot:GFYU01003552.1.p1 GENE.GFYU01003552.1~~GFYU01003552.1.p1  ORF type:complete len:829 (-),score=201.78 GFYU01003552.1:170-2656(-)
MGKDKGNIEIYARIRPTGQNVDHFEIENNNKLLFRVKRDMEKYVINNQKTDYEFSFNHIFDMATTQDQIFDKVAKPSIDNVLKGINATIFAYGQTGSGKTFTITGGPERYADRGLIPRSLTYLFNQMQKSTDVEYELKISYFEIYTEVGYDLLAEKQKTKGIEDLPKVKILLDETDGAVAFQNLRIPAVHTEDEALNYLFIGDVNRSIAETTMNQASTRGHTIFTIYVTSSVPGSALQRTAKLHLVDLAGSERVHKTGAEGLLLKEASSINTSLLYLYQVILALGEKKQHIPYRNSMLTKVLKDSLGGNCRTVMISTLNVEKKQADESISTCRFAQRAALISNYIMVNETVNSDVLIRRLRKQIRELEEELAYYRNGGEGEINIDDEERQRLRGMVQTYIEDTSPEASLAVGHPAKVKVCFELFKEIVSDESQRASGGVGEDYAGAEVQNKMKKLYQQLQQRDNEIKILVNLVKKKGAVACALVQTGDDSDDMNVVLHGKPSRWSNRKVSVSSNHKGIFGDDAEGDVRDVRASLRSSDSMRKPDANRVDSGGNGHALTPPAKPLERRSSDGNMMARQPSFSQQDSFVIPGTGRRPSKIPDNNLPGAEILNEPETLRDRKKAFDFFQRQYPKRAAVEENKQLLKSRIEEAKAMGEKVYKMREHIGKLKQKIEHRRAQRAVAGDEDHSTADPEEDHLRHVLADEKTKYNDLLKKLKHIKPEIEHIQHLLEQSRMKMQKDFEEWYTIMLKLAADAPQTPPQSDEVRSAWASPGADPTVRRSSKMMRSSTNPVAVSDGSVVPESALTGNAEADAEIKAFYEARARRKSQLGK